MARGKKRHTHTLEQRGQPSYRPAPQPASSNDSNRFLSLPPELIDGIVDHLHSRGDVYALIRSCKSLYHRYRLRELVVAAFRHLRRSHIVYYLEGTTEGQFGWKPFTILSADLISKKHLEDDKPDSALLGCVSHDFAEFHPESPTRDYLVVQITQAGLYLDEDGADWHEPAQLEFYEWDQVFRGRLEQATPELIEERFGHCPECKGSRKVEYGSHELAQRQVDLLLRQQSLFPNEG